jgi:hypothetical protein
LPGKWELYEYYTEPGENLIHKKEAQIKKEKLFAQFEFLEDEKFLHNSNLPAEIIKLEGVYSWSISKNFITLIHEKDFRDNKELQFAIVKDTLKLLKKDSFGKIEFFGFFRKAGTKIK